jgi:hypothetical protein
MTPNEVDTMNMTSKRQRVARLQNRVDFQVVEDSAPATTEQSNVVKTTEFGSVRRGTFSITVKSDEKDEKGEAKVLYQNDAEPFEYEAVDGFVNMLRHAGARFNDTQIDFIGQALVSDNEENSKETGKSLNSIVSMYNSKLKADAKSSAYAALVNKYKPLEGEKKESAQSRLVANFVKLAGVSVETAIDMLKQSKALPEDFTKEDLVPLRKRGGDDE